MADLDRIKRNVARMAAQNAPVADIDGYIASEGVTVDQVRAHNPGPQIDPQKRQAAMGELRDKIEANQPQPSFLTSARETLGDATTSLAQGLTLGASDEILAGMQTPVEMIAGAVSGEDSGKGFMDRLSDAYSRGLANERSNLATARERSPAASIAGEITGGIVTGGGLAKGGVTLLSAAKPTARSMIGRGAAEGAAYGGVYGFNSGEGLQDRVDQAAGGAALGAVTGGAAGGLAARGAARAASREIPSVDELRQAAQAAYQRADDAGVIIDASRVNQLVSNVQTRLADEGVDKTLHANVVAAFNRLQDEASNHVTFKGLDILRRVANSAGRGLSNPDEARLSGHIIDAIDDLMNNLRPSDVIAGDARAASKAVVEARDLWKRMRKTELLEGLIERATDRVGANYTAAGFQTAVRQELRSLLNNKRNIRGFSKAEKGLMRSVVRGGNVENMLRQLGKFAPRGVVGATLGGGAGYTMGGPVGAAAVWGAGEAAKAASSRMSAAKINSLLEYVRKGGPRALQSLPEIERQVIDGILAGTATQQDVVMSR